MALSPIASTRYGSLTAYAFSLPTSSNANSKKASSSFTNISCSPLHRSSPLKIDCSSQWSTRDMPNSHVVIASAVEKTQLPKGDSWSVHKFGGTCVGSSERIQNVANVISKDTSERKLIVVSAMSKVTDMMYDLIYKAQSRNDLYTSALDAIHEKHKLTAVDLLDGSDLAALLSKLHDDINNLKAMLHAIYIVFHWW